MKQDIGTTPTKPPTTSVRHDAGESMLAPPIEQHKTYADHGADLEDHNALDLFQTRVSHLSDEGGLELMQRLTSRRSAAELETSDETVTNLLNEIFGRHELEKKSRVIHPPAISTNW